MPAVEYAATASESLGLPVAAASRRETVSRPADGRFYQAASRVLDIALSATALMLAAPVLLCAALAIKLTSRGPVFFRQQRAGLRRQPFAMYKLRTMYVGADDDKELFRRHNSFSTGPCFKMKNDPRVTRVGRWLRRTSLDELPQLWNVLRGDMAMVGPRPLPMDEALTDTPERRLRLMVKPGITCLWQVCGRTEIPYEEWLALDVWYICHRTLSVDLQILVKTVPAVLSARGAY